MNDFARHAESLRKLASAVSAADKARGQGNPEAARRLEEAWKLAEQLDWPGFVEELKRAGDQVRQQRAAALHSRREHLLRAARDAGVPFAEGERAVRVGIFRVEFDGEAAAVRLGGVLVEQVKETDGNKLFARLSAIRERLDQAAFHRETFFKNLKAAYAACRQMGMGDEFVAVKDLHRELLLERARQTEAFRKTPDPKHIPAYPFYQFVFDLARFIQEGPSVGSERLVTTPPSMRESKDAVLIPNLENPIGNETSAARLAIKPSA